MLLELFHLPERKGSPETTHHGGVASGIKKYMPRKTVDFVKYGKRDQYEFLRKSPFEFKEKLVKIGYKI